MQGAHQDQYTLYIRRSDRAMHLVEQRTGIAVAIETTLASLEDIGGIFIRLQEETRVGVYLMEDEIRVVDSLPVVSRRNKDSA